MDDSLIYLFLILIFCSFLSLIKFYLIHPVLSYFYTLFMMILYYFTHTFTLYFCAAITIVGELFTIIYFNNLFWSCWRPESMFKNIECYKKRKISLTYEWSSLFYLSTSWPVWIVHHALVWLIETRRGAFTVGWQATLHHDLSMCWDFFILVIIHDIILTSLIEIVISRQLIRINH